jgi:hypothetical protein
MPRIVAGAGLLLALAALMDGGRGLADALPPVRVTFTVPQALLVAIAVVMTLAWLVLLVVARARRRPEEELESQRPLPWWRQVLGPVAVLLPVIATVLVLWLDGGRLAGMLLDLGRWFQGPGAPSADVAEIPVISLPWLGWSVGLLGLALALAILTVALLLLFGERLVGWWLARRARAERADLVEAVDDSLDDLGGESDPRVAIINCYRRFEAATARRRVRRAPWQTADEFMRDALGHLALPDVAVERLTRLFEVARFSHHPLGNVERDRARASLEEIRIALEGRGDLVVA